MRLLVSRTGPDGAEQEVEVEVEAVASATVADLASALIDAGRPGGQRLHLEGVPLAPDALLTAAGVRHGCRLQVGTTGPRDVVVAALDVTGGLLAGQVLPLPAGSHVLGRGGSLVLAHATVSARHVLVRVAADGSTSVQDLGSRNGTLVDGAAVPPGGAPLAAGSTMRLGALHLQHRPPLPPARRTLLPQGDGRAALHRPPRARTVDQSAPVPVPRNPGPAPPRTPFTWSAAVVPLVLGLAMGALLGPMFALFALLSPVAVVGSWAEQRVRLRRHRRQAEQDLGAAADELRRLLAAWGEHERARAARDLPDVAALVRRARGGDPRLWERRADHDDALVLRLGTGPVVCLPPLDERPDPAWSSRAPLAAAVADHQVLPDVAVALDLRLGDVGVVGPADAARAVARSLLVQAVVLHGPADLGLRAPGSGWRWTRWLPHLGADPGPHGCLLVVDDGAPPASSTEAAAHEATLRRLVVRSAAHELPASCRWLVQVDEDGTGSWRDLAAGSHGDGLLLDGTPLVVAEEVARDLAHLQDPELGSQLSLPTSISLHELVDLDDAALAQAWAHPPVGLPAVVGRTAGGPLVLDLVEDGPHALVAGTTGAGKSELLRTLVAALAAATPPTHLALVLLDFKGGSAFDRCAELPHVAGVVTDLDVGLAERVLHGLEVELRAREARLRAAGVDDLAAWRRRCEPDEEPLPRLVLVVDELAVLASGAPEVLRGLVDVAQRGRSLGIHLVLATQRPAGVVTDHIRANTNLRLALRTVDSTDSWDVVGGPQAAHLERRTPGRVVVRAGNDEPTVAQTAWSTAPNTSEAATAPVVVRSVDSAADGGVAPPTSGTTDLDRLVTAARAVAAGRGLARPIRPWTEPLPRRVHRKELTATGRTVPLAVLDDREQRRRPTWCWDPGLGHLVAHGASGAGLTTTLAVAAAGAAELGASVHLVDPDGSLRAHPSAPEWATVTAGDDHDELRLLLDHLDRLDRLDQPHDRGQVVVVDRWHAVAAGLDDLAGSRLLDQLVRRLAAGPRAGVVAAIGLDRATGLPSALAPAASQRLVLRLGDAHDIGLVGVTLPSSARRVLADAPPGRAVVAPEGLEAQVAHP